MIRWDKLYLLDVCGSVQSTNDALMKQIKPRDLLFEYSRITADTHWQEMETETQLQTRPTKSFVIR